MALSNKERIGRALDLLETGLSPFVEVQLKNTYGDEWRKRAEESVTELRKRQASDRKWDVQVLLSIVWNNWNSVFGNILSRNERSLVSEIRDIRNAWAHQGAFVLDDAYRALDSIERLLKAVSATEALEVGTSKREILRLRYEEEAKRELKTAAASSLEGTPLGNLPAWRDVMFPHDDVKKGTFQQAEFAADLWAVHSDNAEEEYADPKEFFRRTFPTEGIKQLLTNALIRLSGKGGDPVVELQTNFGGGKTHSMLALYHLFSGVDLGALRDIEPVIKKAGVEKSPSVKRAVYVGSVFAPANVYKKPDGAVVHTMWGEIAWQLGQYKLVADADKAGVSPGREVLQKVLEKAAPCLILIDEWVVHVRQTNKKSETSLPGGALESHFSFAQELTEAVTRVPNALLVASIPASDIEVGGSRGKEVLESLKNVFKRVAVAWRPASTDEGFEIVRRRLFEPLAEDKRAQRDAVVKAFSEFYGKQSAEFPPECKEADYRRRLEASYPIHPELFDKLYTAWSTLEKFQRTRGVLRLMASVIHTLWMRNDSSLMILPAMVPIDEHTVKKELLGYLEQTWDAVIDKDVDGSSSLPWSLDTNNPNFNRVSAARRVSRTLFLGSAPNSQNRGLEDLHIKLGCSQPGESVAVFGDALRRLTDQASHIYVEGKRYWIDTQPSVTRLALDRALQFKNDDVIEEIKRRLREDARTRSEFDKIYPAPASSGDIPDELETRLVFLSPEHPHVSKNGGTKEPESPARDHATGLLQTRAGGPREYKNTLIFVAADKRFLPDLDNAVRQYLAWQSIENDQKKLDLTPSNMAQVASKIKDSDRTVDTRLPETYSVLLIPSAGENGKITLREERLPGSEPLANKAVKKLKLDGESFVSVLGPSVLRHYLDKIPLWRTDHVEIRKLKEDFARYVYLPRLKDSLVLGRAIEEGLRLVDWKGEGFAYADSFDEANKRYNGLRACTGIRADLDGSAVLVKPSVAAPLLDSARAESDSAKSASGQQGTLTGGVSPKATGGLSDGKSTPSVEKKRRRFHGAIQVEAGRMSRDAGQIAQEIVQHLNGLVDAKVQVTLEISGEFPEGVPDSVVRTVSENCRTLKFKTFGFEED